MAHYTHYFCSSLILYQRFQTTYAVPKLPYFFTYTKNNHLENIANDKEAVARKIAGDSADRDFLLNYTNTIFDFIQIRALKNMWRGQINRPTTFNQRMAQETALDELAYIGKNADEIAKIMGSANKANKLIRGIKQGIGGFNTVAFAQFSEGLEEGINYISEQEGITYGNQLLNKEVDNGFDLRLKNYLANGHLYDNMFWGWMGGIMFEGVGSQLGKAKNIIKDKLSKASINGKIYSEDKSRLSEINSRKQKAENFIDQMKKEWISISTPCDAVPLQAAFLQNSVDAVPRKARC